MWDAKYCPLSSDAAERQGGTMLAAIAIFVLTIAICALLMLAQGAEG